jgi:hypothetical protein
MTGDPARQSATEGGCRCGRVRLRVTGAPLFTAACHCRGCQQMSASAFSLSSCYLSGGFELLSGEPVIGGVHGPDRHYFCPHCMSWLYTRPAGMDDIFNVRTTQLDVPPTEPPYIETYVSSALPWAKTGASHSFLEFPPMERFSELMKSFAERAAI